MNAMRRLKRGDVIRFGAYPQTKAGKRLPIRWRVLRADEGSALLLSEFALDFQPLFQPEAGAPRWSLELGYSARTYLPQALREIAGRGYADSWVRAWLNGEFLRSAFAPDERELLLDADGLGRVFLLGLDDVNDAALFPTARSIACRATPWAMERLDEAARRETARWVCWWLRNDGAPFAIYSGRSGFAGEVCTEFATTEPLAVRPAILLDLAARARSFED